MPNTALGTIPDSLGLHLLDLEYLQLHRTSGKIEKPAPLFVSGGEYQFSGEKDLLDTMNSYTFEPPLHGYLHSSSRKAENDGAHVGCILIKSLDGTED